MNKLILDLDGTLWETKDSYLYAYDKLVKDLSINPRYPDEKILEYMGIKLDKLCYDLFSGYGDLKEIGMKAVYYSIEYVTKNPHLLSLNMKDLFKRLSENYNIYIISNCPRVYLDTFINIADVKEYITNSYTIDDGEKEEHLRLITNNYKEKALFVGDSHFDYESIENHSKVYFIYAKYGYIKTDTYDYFINGLDELDELLKKINIKERMIDNIDYQIISKNDSNLTIMNNNGKLLFGFLKVNDYLDFKEVLKRLKSFIGNKEIIGPINAKTWYSYRMALDSFDFKLFPDCLNDETLLNLFLEEGFKIHQIYSSNLADIDSRIENYSKRVSVDDSYKTIIVKGNDCYNYIDELYPLCKRVFEKADYYRDINILDFKELYLSGINKINPDLILIYKYDKLVSFHFGYCDPLNRFYVSKTIGIEPNERFGKTFWVLAKSFIDVARSYGYDKILYHFLNDRTGMASNVYKHNLIKKKKYGLLRYKNED